jgi:NitT/TauT family transport system substrate-binding protein
MHTIDLAYVGRGPHEELVTYIADQQGFYADEGVHVALHDGCVWDAERLRHGAVIGLGRTVLSRLNDGIPWVALNVNTARPLFWFLARPGLTSLADLAGQRLAVTPPHTGPGIFTRIVLRKAGLDVDRDVQTIVRWPGDYAMDLRWLREGKIDAAMVGTPWRRRRWPPSTAGRCWPSSATTSRFPPWAWPSTPPTPTRTAPRSRPSYEPTGAPCR